VDDTGESLDLSSSEVNRKIISSNFTKTRMNSDDSFSSDSQSISCEKCTKIGIHPIQTPSKETDEECCKTSRRSSRRIIDCSQDCPICWDRYALSLTSSGTILYPHHSNSYGFLHSSTVGIVSSLGNKSAGRKTFHAGKCVVGLILYITAFFPFQMSWLIYFAPFILYVIVTGFIWIVCSYG